MEGEKVVRSRRPRDRKQQIVIAAREKFVARGYPNVTMAQIAEAVGITAGALYRHFDNKTALLSGVVADSFTYLDTPIEDGEFEAVVEDAISRVIDRPYLSDLWIREIRYLPEEARRELRTRIRSWAGTFAPALRRRCPGVDEGQVELLQWALLSLLSSVGRRAMHAPAPVLLDGVRTAMNAITSAALIPTGDAEEPHGPLLRPRSMRERLLTAAADQFGRRGFRDTSMADIGAVAEVSGQNLYAYFANKADLLRAVIDRSITALWLGLDQALSTSAVPDAALARVVGSYIVLSRSWVGLLEDPTDETDTEEVTKGAQREYVGEWVALLQATLPHVGEPAARVRVQLALFLVSDLQRNHRIARRASFQENLRHLVLAILLDGSPSGGPSA
ncbi:TetR/AcrR family transcriptional regulator [Tsukamurella soli]|uniref:TetR/AcrR family transcriptional regulator n=1 Tax=Tsukamurella soli TaxID=644556 RepID=A0ABP8J1X2_9ACTN